MIDTLLELLNSTSVVITVVTFLIIGFARAITRIFRMGATWKTELATKEEQKDFEAEIRRDMRGYASQIQSTVLDACMRTIERELKNLDEFRNSVTEMRTMKIELQNEIKNAMEKYDEIKNISDNFRIMNNRLNRLEFGEFNTGERRVDTDN